MWILLEGSRKEFCWNNEALSGHNNNNNNKKDVILKPYYLVKDKD